MLRTESSFRVEVMFYPVTQSMFSATQAIAASLQIILDACTISTIREGFSLLCRGSTSCSDSSVGVFDHLPQPNASHASALGAAQLQQQARSRHQRKEFR